MTRAAATIRTGVRRAFTLVELLVVISVMAVVMIIVLPAIARVLESANYANAVNAVTATLTRVADRGVEGGVAVLFDPHTQRTTLVPLELHARNTQLTVNPPRPATAYRPAAGLAPVTLPRGMAVYGLSFSHDDPATAPDARDAAWYPGERTAGTTGTVNVVNNWLFPRNHPQFYLPDYDPDNLSDANHPRNVAPPTNVDNNVDDNIWRAAASFFIPFTADGRAPGSAHVAGGVRDAYIEYPNLPYNPTQSAHTPTDNERLFRFDPHRYFDGDQSHGPVYNPEVRIRPVDRIAIVDLNRLSAETGVRAPWFVRTNDNDGFPAGSMPITPADKQQFRDEQLVRRVSDWIDEHGEIFAISPNSGKVVRRK